MKHECIGMSGWRQIKVTFKYCPSFQHINVLYAQRLKIHLLSSFIFLNFIAVLLGYWAFFTIYSSYEIKRDKFKLFCWWSAAKKYFTVGQLGLTQLPLKIPEYLRPFQNMKLQFRAWTQALLSRIRRQKVPLHAIVFHGVELSEKWAYVYLNLLEWMMDNNFI